MKKMIYLVVNILIFDTWYQVHIIVVMNMCLFILCIKHKKVFLVNINIYYI